MNNEKKIRIRKMHHVKINRFFNDKIKFIRKKYDF